MDNEINYTPMVVGYLIKEDKVLLGLRKKVSWELGDNLVSGIGGKVADMPELKDETNDEALIREFQEEVGSIPKKFEHKGRVKFIFPNKPKWNQTVEIYTVSEWEGEPTETEAIKPMWYKQSELPVNQMWDDNRLWVPKVLQGETVDLIITYGEDNRTVAEVIDSKIKCK